ncbi:MAG: hypothetical protein IJ064_07515 [Bacteroidaceae bacterium]|nr:hypothetical protein [Bacteroidaceae bacterium]
MNYELNDRDLDDLIIASLERKETLDALNGIIVKEVRRKACHEWVRRWARIAVFSFGMPLQLLIFVAGIYVASRLQSFQAFRYVLLIPIITMSYLAWHGMKNFSIADV